MKDLKRTPWLLDKVGQSWEGDGAQESHNMADYFKHLNTHTMDSTKQA